MVGILYIFLAHSTYESSSLDTRPLLSYIITNVYTFSAIIVYPSFDPFLYTSLSTSLTHISNMPSFAYISPRATSSIPPGNWGTSRPTYRPPPRFVPGDIVWVKDAGDADSRRYIAESRIGGGIDHPAVVLESSRLKEDRVLVCIVSLPK